MPTRNVRLSPELDRFIDDQVAAGHFADASEVVRTALHRLVAAEQEYDTKMAALRAAIDEGDACDPADDISGEDLEAHMNQYMNDLVAKEEGARCHDTV